LGKYFCLGQLGKGTFSSIHKCLDLNNKNIAAAKVELSTFVNSGVLDAEATILDFLHSAIPGNVPAYYGYYKQGPYAALVMEYLGDDMHHLREKVMSNKSRRMHIEDAVQLTLSMLALLQKIHSVGIVHRDVKPSNCVIRKDQEFCMVDFGLSKSMIVPHDSADADLAHPWEKPWLHPQAATTACFRQERPTAEFRGTSMYASVRVHQLKDYCFRDDMYSLLYVFCDLVSGGLPWMTHAANRDRAKCQQVKEQVHGEHGKKDETELLLMGDEYHKANKPPLAMARDERRVGLLKRAFDHLSKLTFVDIPDYSLLEDCIRGFLQRDNFTPPFVRRIEWRQTPRTPKKSRNSLLAGKYKKWSEDFDEIVFEDIVDEVSVSDGKFARLPVQFRFRIAQMEYNVARPDSVPKDRALDDWMRVVLPLLYGEWDTPKFEGTSVHRTSTDGLQRPLYLHLLMRCQHYANTFEDFASRDCYFHASKKRKIQNVDLLVTVSRALYGLRQTLVAEQSKKPPPAALISF
jgi:serine/threonine protein kinase